MRYVIQSKPIKWSHWMYRGEAFNQVYAIIELGQIMKMDRQLRVNQENNYRVNCIDNETTLVSI